MSASNGYEEPASGRNGHNDEENAGEYADLLLLERLESLEEEMEELGVQTLADVRARIRELGKKLDQ